ncbi:MAG: hypothetical protein QM477_09325 [Planctomycetota bacterium]
MRHSLLVDEASVRVEIVQYMEERGRLPETVFVFRILLESAMLRLIKRETCTELSDLRDSMAPWHSFRIQVNAERRSFRRYLLAFLPEHGASHVMGNTASRLPGKHWAQLWDRLTTGIPEACLPSLWRQVRTALPSVAPQSIDFESDLVIPPRRDWNSLLAEPLFRAGAALESRRPGTARLILPSGLVPADSQRFALELEVKMHRFGGLPQLDSKLKNALEQISAWRIGGVQPQVLTRPSDFLKLAEEMGFSAVSVRTLRSAIDVRASRLPQARVLLEQSLSKCTSPNQVGTVLGNISGLLVAEGEYQSAFHYAQQALQYNPGSKVARYNFDKLVELFQSGYNLGAQNHA